MGARLTLVAAAASSLLFVILIRQPPSCLESVACEQAYGLFTSFRL